ncbi:MAG: hypothetical protein COA52_00600 [Hyphomicrobiales bacterium]|nr:MAG: hypothetical protein COA52_00600 [Hyphomicrobiales bacterium]
MDFYTFFQRYKSDLLISGYENGKKVNKVVPLKPYLFAPSNKGGIFSSMEGEKVKKIDFTNTWEASKFIKEYEDIENFNIYGSTYYDYVHINDAFPIIKNDNTKLRIGNYDIETDSEGGFADLETANKEITSISLGVMHKRDIYLLGVKDYDPEKSEILKKEIPHKKVKYIKCENEKELLEKFIEIWVKLKFDCISGWFINGYDNLYTIRRIRRILGDSYANKLSPYGMIKEHSYEKYGKTKEQYEIVGIPTIDYIEAYAKFSFKNVESYKLDYISHLELDKKKLDYSKYKTLARLYKENPALFYDYNIIDIVRVEELEHKLKFIDLMFSLAYFTKTNVLDGFATVKPCDVVIHNTLMKKNIVVPHNKKSEQSYRQIAGGYVKHPKPGFYKYLMSFDLTSLYPFLIMCFNISPDVYIGKMDQYDNLGTADQIIHDNIFDHLREKLVKENVCITPKGTIFSREKQGVFAEIMEEGFNLRKSQKDEMLKYKKLKESAQGSDKDKWAALATEYGNRQLATKIFLNAFYGGLANPYSRWFNYDIAESITMSGQLVTKYIENEMNTYFNKILKTKDIDYIITSDTDSVAGDSLIYVNDKKIKIEDYYNSLENNFILNDTFNENYVKEVSGDTTKCYIEGIKNKKINYIMKHKVSKKMYRIKCNGNFVDVTEDHSVIVKNKKTKKISSIKPKNLNPNLHSIINIKTKKIDELITDDFEVEYLGIIENYVYDIEVEEAHNFFANDILVHNSCYINATTLIEKVFPDDSGSQEEITNFLENFAKEVESKAIDVALAKLYKATNIYKPNLHMKLEAIGQGVWRATKNYIMSVWSMEGVRYKIPEIKMQGIEAVKSSTPEICRNYIKDSLKFIVSQDRKGLVEHINKCEAEFYDMPFHKVALPRGVTEIDKWVDGDGNYAKGIPYHVRAALNYNKLLKKKNMQKEHLFIGPGDKMRLSYLTMPNPTRQNIFACPDELPEEFGLEEYVDYPKQFEKSFMKPITSLANAAGISMDNKVEMDQFEE